MDQAITTMANVLFENNRITNRALFIKDVKERESKMSTSMGMDLALPHTRSKSVIYPSLFFGSLEKPITWGEDKVKIILGIAVPDNDDNTNSTYLKILSSLARQLTHDEYRNALINAKDVQTCVDLLSSVQY